MATVTEVQFRDNLDDMFKALDLDQNDTLSWKECRGMVAQVMKPKGGYNVDSFKESYEKMDKNQDGDIQKHEFIETIVELGRQNGLFGLTLIRKATVVRPEKDDLDSGMETDDDNVDPQLFRKGLSCLGKTFNNARHAYLKLDISGNELKTVKVSICFDLLKLTDVFTLIGYWTLQIPSVYRCFKQWTQDSKSTLRHQAFAQAECK